MTSPGSYEPQPNAYQPYPPQQYPRPPQQQPAQQNPYAPQQHPGQQPQFAHPSAPVQPGYPQQQAQPTPHQPQGQPTSWRTLTIDLKQPPWYGWTWLQPTVTIDGFAYSAGWTRLNYTVPAGRPVYVQCHVNYLWEYGKAATTLDPRQQPHLEYTAPAQAYFPGDIGAPGTTKANGKGVAIGILCFFGAIIVLMLGLLVLSVGLAVASSY
ncbi:hypothetical protein [Labedella endophytica]|uniref:Uncharacterized protein n=1 Tax=Labedella endophytica TaxID=1523160 RepID=A0A3S0VTL3_9MICO|nr:hypothetical protein [Labedella endophytica]RUR01034.1 hypothetical protein ELQ94_05750 [Labedella endophytica]